MKKYKVKEIFGPTIQGEGTHAGQVVMFLRFTGCNRWDGREESKDYSICKFCDTDFVGGDSLTRLEILERLNNISGKCKTVVISGGEPTLQIDYDLLEELEKDDWVLHLETNGSKALGTLGQFFSHVTMSPKQNKIQTYLEHCDDLKLLYPWISDSVTSEEFKEFRYNQLFVQPQWGSDMDKVIKYCTDNPKTKLSLQMHKLIGVE